MAPVRSSLGYATEVFAPRDRNAVGMPIGEDDDGDPERPAGPHIISLRRAEKYETRYYFKVAKDYFK